MDETAKPLRVALVNMPWARIDAPSIQCGLLKALAVREGHHCEVHYLNIELAVLLGPELYEGISDMRSERLHMLGEWLFAYAAFGEVVPEQEYFEEHPELEALWRELTGRGLDHLVELRRAVLPAWLDKALGEVDWGGYDLVGFTSTFLQNTASLAAGRLLKERFPNVSLVYGGANFDSEMGPEYARGLPWLDHVVSGEADEAFPALLRQMAGGPAGAAPGAEVAGARMLLDQVGPARPLRALDGLPVPDYREYFNALERHGRRALLGDRPVRLPVEFSRGCWWGAKHHCTFCGLNSAGMAFRSKSGERAMDELTELLTAYPTVHVDAVDNILDMTYLTSLCEELGNRHWDVNLFFEVKANLTRGQLKSMRNAGILRIQPGIESLNTRILGLMRKGATKSINVRLLKWARYFGQTVQWNVLTGIPGESDADYEEQVALIPLLHHLEPPSGSARIWLERFSPYFTDPSFRLSHIRPGSSYRHIYPSHLDHAKIAYFFDYGVTDVASERAVDALSAAVLEWQRRWAEPTRPTLLYQRLPHHLTLIDRRTERARKAVLEGWQAHAYEACGDAARSVQGVRTDLERLGHRLATAEVAAFLERCCRSRVMIEDEGRYLALALPENPDW
ncbi:RiPP maturation radical SAM C-methyltransferase [Streptomyces bambusae]|uniref:RiPP maturation radical SAM C-methyltransferase n=1 Tax=Streptomyces bambusae TaxID=1550616 RepID=UPI001CFC999D|nr:RiPP maturation radical SAM C-methyltransferase [Streptomyces bambusae]MCB5166988.1 RiPP maturation radical SAM C-methyltransferase [Streptomyces bambusae]